MDLIEVNLKFNISPSILTLFSYKLKEIELEQLILSNFKLDEYEKSKLNIMSKQNKILKKNEKTDKIKSGVTYEFNLDEVFKLMFTDRSNLLYFSPFIPSNEIKVHEKIAEGGFGEIYKCTYENGDINKNYVLKNLKYEDETILKAYYQEISTYSKLNHPNIPKFIGITYEIFIKHGFIMEYISGDNLLEFVSKNKSIDEIDKLNIIYQISDVLCFLHQNEIIHRDIKPNNIIVRKDSFNKIKIFLLDYGLSRVTDDKIILNSFRSFFQSQVHVYQYLNGKDLYNLNSFDIWSFGCIVYFIYTGNHPYNMNVQMMTKAISKKEKFYLKKEFKEEFIYNLVDNCCRFNANERISAEKIKLSLFCRLNNIEAKLNQTPCPLIDLSNKEINLLVKQYQDSNKCSDESFQLAFIIGDLFLDEQNYSEALRFHKISLETKLDLKANPDSQANSYIKLAYIYSKKPYFIIEEAKRNYTKALNIKESLKNKDNISNLYYDYANFLFEIGETLSSLDYHKKAYEIRLSTENIGLLDINTAASVYKMGLVYRSLRDFKNAFDFLKKAEMIYKNYYHENHIMNSEILYEIALTLFDLSKYNEALQYLGRLEIIKNNSQNLNELAKIFTLIGSIHNFLFNFSRSEEYHKKTLCIYNKLCEEVNAATCLNNLGIVYKNDNQLEKALDHFFNALQIFQKHLPNDHEFISNSYLNIGTIYTIKQDVQDKTKCFWGKKFRGGRLLL